MKDRTIRNPDGSMIIISDDEIIFVPVDGKEPVMKKKGFWGKILAAVGISAFLLCSVSHSASVMMTNNHRKNQLETYVVTSTWTPGGGVITGTKAFAFQNTSADIDVAIDSIEFLSVTSGTVTSGPVQFWVYTATQVTHGSSSNSSIYSRQTPNISTPSYISYGINPTAVLFEGKQNAQLPRFIVLVNADETSTVLPQPLNPLATQSLPHDDVLMLKANTNMAIVIEQRQYGATDYTAGLIFCRIVFTTR